MMNSKPQQPKGEGARERRANQAKKNLRLAQRVRAWRKKTYGK